MLYSQLRLPIIDVKRTLFVSSCLLSCLLVSGCGGGENTDGPQRFQLEGTVTYDGNPVPKGEIAFRPDPAAGNKGPGGYATIDQGKFTVATDKGVVGGAYIFTISGFDGVPIPASDVGEPTLEGKALFSNIEIKKELPKEDSQIELEVPVNSKTKKKPKK
ncbi:hypothetical protein [uncultured Gimesia sp.]|uniref:hypothetical protein n=1 Tax=uncultured Gimesia sp. TaxID=1678688 RepID=UPI0030D7BDD7|tara:strand:+ start:27318 stop:27797 length:480 start_codon:yes stop_codon:yes gene_type:complete